MRSYTINSCSQGVSTANILLGRALRYRRVFFQTEEEKWVIGYFSDSCVQYLEKHVDTRQISEAAIM